MRHTPSPPQLGRSPRFSGISLLIAIMVAVVLQFAASAKVASGAQSLQLLKEAAIAERAGLIPIVTSTDLSWLIPPGGIVESGILLDFAVAVAEFSLVILVLLLHRGRLLWGLLSLVFAAFFGYALFRGLNNQPCGCFGTLWQPPNWVSIAIDAVVVTLAVGLLVVRRTPRYVLGTVLALVIAASLGGFLYARSTDPITDRSSNVPLGPAPDASSKDRLSPTSPPEMETTDSTLPPADRLLQSSLLAEVREMTSQEPGLAVYVFIWSPECSTCQAMKPTVDALAEQYKAESNPILQVFSLQKRTIAARLNIQEYEWESSPMILIVQDSQIVATYSGENSPLPTEVFDALMTAQPLEDIVQ